jgi:uncharacterized membrane protein YfcA
MPLNESLILAIGMIVFAGSLLQSVAGFGFGMFAIPVLILLGCPPPQAIVIVAICGAVQTISGLVTLRRHIVWRQSAWMIALAAAAIPPGVWTLGELQSIGQDRIRQFFGLLVLLGLIAHWAARVKPRDQVPIAWGLAATSACGYLSGLAGMGGPPVVIWIMSHRWPPARIRVTLWVLFTGLTPIQLLFLYIRFGDVVGDAVVQGIAYAPLAGLALLPGMWIGRRLPRKRLRQLSFAILATVSAYAILQPVVL